MNVTFSAEQENCDLNSFEEVPEGSILGDGCFSKEQIGELLSCFNYSALTVSDNL
ncbi:hypothetical protein [Pseudoalteromonas sp. MEBiC 03607]|uniref:hypothetical protein n=1 Tax=Pseudoalteromonas sp. MEBiC 03607 TaxID=2563601 RepID=UPI001F0DE49E|nr:hypothetical protein [Pseudoalteromonas sp. MEBiC 03607]